MSELSKDFVKTNYKCPECGEPVFKHFHRRDHPSTQTYEWYCYYCYNLCWLDCRNCRNCNTHGECDLDFCRHHNNWKPKIECKKCGKKADYLVITGRNIFGNEIKEPWCNDCIEKRKKEEKDKNIGKTHLKRPDE